MRIYILSCVFLCVLCFYQVSALSSLDDDIDILDLSEPEYLDYGASFDLMVISSSASNIGSDELTVTSAACSPSGVSKCPIGNQAGKYYQIYQGGVQKLSLPQYSVGTIVRFHAGNDFFTFSNGVQMSGFIVCRNDAIDTCGSPNSTISRTNLAVTASGAVASPMLKVNDQVQFTFPSVGGYCLGDQITPGMGFCVTASALSSAVVSMVSVAVAIAVVAMANLMVDL